MIENFNTARSAQGKRAAKPICRVAALSVAAVMCFNGMAYAARIKVNNAAGTSVSGSCTIVDAVASINQGSIVANGNTCTNSGGAFGSGDTVDLSLFPAGTLISFTQTIPNPELSITKPMTIRGNLGNSGLPLVTIRHSVESFAAVRLIDTTADLTIDAVTLSNSGGIQAEAGANLTFIHSVIFQNRWVGDGGGIQSQAAVTLIGSTVAENTAYHNASLQNFSGGGIFAASVVASDSTISGNTAGGNGGGIFAPSVGLTNTTVSSNSTGADGGGIYAQNATLNYCTVANNIASTGIGGGVGIGPGAAATLAATATLMYGNPSGNDLDSSVAQTLAGDHNLIGVVSRNISVPGDTRPCDPKLDVLANYGGPTQTHALASDSCAIDAGPTNPPATVPSDQRGRNYMRRIGAATDIGAFEAGTSDRIFYDGLQL